MNNVGAMTPALRSARRAGIAAAMSAMLLASGCATSSDPSGFLPPAQKADQEPYGVWADVQYYFTDDYLLRMRGELIAITADSVHVLTASGWGVIAIADVREAKLTTFAQNLAPIGLWGFAGVLSAGSHGYVGVLSIPTWVIISITSNSWASRHPRVLLPGGRDPGWTGATFPSSEAASSDRGTDHTVPATWSADWKEARMYARFPQGLPPTIDRSSLKPKPLPPPRPKRTTGRGIEND